MLLLVGVAITLVDNNMAKPKATGLINTDFQNADDIWVVLLTGKFRVFKLTGTIDDDFRSGRLRHKAEAIVPTAGYRQ